MGWLMARYAAQLDLTERPGQASVLMTFYARYSGSERCRGRITT